MTPNQNNQTSPKPAQQSASKKPMNKKTLTLIIAIAGSVVVIAIVIFVLLMVFSSNKLSCTQEKEMYGAQFSTTTDAFFSGNKLTKLDSTGTISLSSNSNSSTNDRLYEYAKSYFTKGSVTKDGDSIVIKETAETGDNGRISSNFVTLFGSADNYTKESFKKAMESNGYTCK